MKKRDYLFIILLIVIDQLTKLFISSSMALGESFELIKNFFCITYTRNTGAAFSILKGQKYFFIVSALVAVVLIIYYLNRNKCSFWEKLGLLLIAAGAIGNLIDRVRFSEVIDFLDFYIFGYDFPIFNFADCCITVGAAVVILSVLLERKSES